MQSPKRLVNECLKKLKSPDASPEATNILLQSIERMVSDHAVAAEFVNAHGMDYVMDAVRKKQTTQSLVLIFNEVMGHEDLFSWEDRRIDAPFVEHVAENIETERTKRGFTLDDMPDLKGEWDEQDDRQIGICACVHLSTCVPLLG